MLKRAEKSLKDAVEFILNNSLATC